MEKIFNLLMRFLKHNDMTSDTDKLLSPEEEADHNAQLFMEQNRHWMEFDLQIREYHFKRYAEHMRAGVEFSKMVVSNLILINAAGIASLPIITKFANIEHAPRTVEILVGPAINFGVGLLCSIICAFVTYANYMALADLAVNQSGVENNRLMNSLKKTYWHPEVRRLINKNISTYSSNAERRASIVNATFAVSIIFGFISAGLFLRACWIIISLDPSDAW